MEKTSQESSQRKCEAELKIESLKLKIKKIGLFRKKVL